ncbi:MAG: restriction endonuclease subunit S [Actinobacteria bacterium]|nr:restriction endonuclease subunit S [Actinomycetota bacterium]
MSNHEKSLPGSWSWASLNDIGRIAAGGTPATKNDENFNGNVAWLTPADLSGYTKKYISRGKRNISERGFQTSAAVLLPEGSVLFSSRAPIGYVVIASNPIATNQGFKNLMPYDGIINEYVYYYLKGSKPLVEGMASGTTFLEVSAKRFSAVPIPIAPTNEQHRIVAKIEDLFTNLDAGVEALKKVQAQIKRYRHAVLKYAFEGKLTAEWREAHKDDLEPASVLLERIKDERKKKLGGKYKEPPAVDTSDLPELPDGWEWTNVGLIATSMTNGIYKQKHFYADDGIACLRMYNIDDGRIVWKDIKRMNVTPEEIEGYGLKPGDILINRVNSWELVGKSAIIPEGLETCVFESKNIRLRLNEAHVSSKYIQYWLQLHGHNYFSRNFQQTTGMASINQTQLGLMEVPLTSVEEQMQIVEDIERRFSIADEIQKVLVQSIMQSDRLRQSILKRAFEGKLVPQDPTDEPAEMLLERINEEGTKQAAGAKKTKSKRGS